MWETKNLIVPQFNYVGYLEKTILAPLTASLFMGLLGPSGFSARMPSVLCALLEILITFIFTRRFFSQQTAGRASLILLTSLG